MLLSGKTVLVTGGARGIGANITRVLAREGANVAINYATSGARAEEIAGEIRDAGGNARTYGADVRDADAVKTMMDAVAADFGRVDGLVNNAIGGTQNRKFAEATLADYQNMLDFGAIAVINTIKAAHPHMKAQGGGRIINIVTELWNMGSGDWSAYLAGKGAMVGVSRALANELGPDNITVNMVAPGWMADEKIDTNSDGSKNFAKSVPMRVHGSGDEIGNGCVFFLSHLAGYVTGAYLPVTGGRITQMG